MLVIQGDLKIYDHRHTVSVNCVTNLMQFTVNSTISTHVGVLSYKLDYDIIMRMTDALASMEKNTIWWSHTFTQ